MLNVPASLLDEDVPQIGLPDPVQPVQAPFPKTKTPLSKPLEKLKQFGEWLFSYIPPRPRVLNTAFNALKQKVMSLYKKSFEVKESESALGGFTTKYTIVVVKCRFWDKLHLMTPPKTLFGKRVHSMTPPQNSLKKFHKLHSMTPTPRKKIFKASSPKKKNEKQFKEI